MRSVTVILSEFDARLLGERLKDIMELTENPPPAMSTRLWAGRVLDDVNDSLERLEKEQAEDNIDRLRYENSTLKERLRLLGDKLLGMAKEEFEDLVTGHSALPIEVQELVHTKQKIPAIKALRAYFEERGYVVGLKEAKDVIDREFALIEAANHATRQ